ncbi:MAG: hypothetical protein [Verticillium dahliae ormycovirus 2]|nr:MAG: hypothetical protein [Verticillium dahliae ormycovirus 2]
MTSYSLAPSASKGLTETYREVDDLPVAQMRAVLRDCMLDLLSVDSEMNNVASVQDGVRVISACVDRNLLISPPIERTGFIRELSSMIELIMTSQSISETERLVNALNYSRDDPNTQTLQNVVVTGNVIVVRVPSYDTSNTGQVDNLGKYLRWCVTILGIKNPEVKILPDQRLGNAVILPARLERALDTTLAALSLPPNTSGDRAEFKTGFKANLVELIAAIKVMRRYQGSLQKMPAPKGKKALVVTLDDLRQSVNGRMGLNEHGLPAFASVLVKSILNELTKPNNSRFPGKWIASVKETNGVKTNTGLLYKMGYEGAVANPQKTITVVRTAVEFKPKKKAENKTSSVKTKEEGKFEVVTRTKESHPDGINHREFRLGAFLLLPLIDPKSKEGLKDQISVDPVSIKNKTILSFYKRNRDVVDAMNLAYATYKAIGKKDSKATPLGYRSARGHSVSLTANREWQDASGTTYQKFMEVPEHVRNFLLSFLNRKVQDEDSESDNDEEYDTASPQDKGEASKEA